MVHTALFLFYSGIINNYYIWVPQAVWEEKMLMGYVFWAISRFFFKGSTSWAPGIGNGTSSSQLPSPMNTTQLSSTSQFLRNKESNINAVAFPDIVPSVIICICIYKCVKKKSHPQGGKEQTGVSLWLLVGLVCWGHGTGVSLGIRDVNSSLHASIARALLTKQSCQAPTLTFWWSSWLFHILCSSKTPGTGWNKLQNVPLLAEITSCFPHSPTQNNHIETIVFSILFGQ